MKAICYSITLKAPAILTAIEGEPNSSVSYDFIPGSVMRGVIIGAFMRQTGIRDLDLLDPTIQRLFFSEQTRYLNAYPAINDHRSLPVPGSWREKKYPSGKAPRQVYDDAIGRGGGIDKMTNVKGFVDYQPGTGQAAGYRPQRVLNIHTQRARRLASEQLVYRYDALAPDQTFQGVILCQHDTDIDDLLTLTSALSQIYIGGARSAGYGLAAIDHVYFNDQWSETDHSIDSTIVLTLLSDMILRDERGQYTTAVGDNNEETAPLVRDVFRHALSRYGIAFDYGDFNALHTVLVGGFNRKWGLPLPQTPALGRGSVITLSNVQGDNRDFARLIEDGLGERRNEGFGRIALNWQQDQVVQFETFSFSDRVPEGEIALSPESDALWRQFMTRAQAQHLDESSDIASVYNNRQYKVTGPISPTQLARLRAKIADELRKPKPSRAFISRFLEDIAGKAAGKQFDNAYLGPVTLAEWLINPHFPDFDERLTRNPKYLLRLIDAVLERAQKDRTQPLKEEA